MATTGHPVAHHIYREAIKNPLPTLPRVSAGKATAYDPQYPPLAVHGVYISGVEVARDMKKYLGLKTDKTKCEKYYGKKYQVKKEKVKGKPKKIRLAVEDNDMVIPLNHYAALHTSNMNAAMDDLLRHTALAQLRDE